MKYKLNLKSEEITLILSALENDKVGSWGDGRREVINGLIRKITSQAIDSTLTGKVGA